MEQKRRILIIGGGTAGWLCAAYLARFLEIKDQNYLSISLLESSDIGVIGVGEGTFPTIRNTLKFLGIDEAQFIRETSATFKQGIRFADWVKTPQNGEHEHYFHPFEPPYYTEGAGLLPYWLLQDEATRLPFAQAVTFQKRVAEARRAPKRSQDENFSGPLNYAYHFDAVKLAKILAKRAVELGVEHLNGTLTHTVLNDTGAIDHINTKEFGALSADLYIDASGFHAELIGKAMKVPYISVRDKLFCDRSLSCKVDYERDDAPLESYTVATAHKSGWTWDIGLNGQRGIGYVYSSDHSSDDEALQILQTYIGKPVEPRFIPFTSGYRSTPWVKNCVAIGLACGFLEPLESTSIVLIEVAVGMIADLFPHTGPIDAPSERFNQLMGQRYENIINFLKLHYCLSQRDEPFWVDNRRPETIPERLKQLLEQWKFRPPGRFDFILDLESFAFFNYQYILYGMGFKTDLSQRRSSFPNVDEADKLFERIAGYGERATLDLPSHRELIKRIYEQV